MIRSAPDEVGSLIQQLHETETRLREVTGGQVDAVMSPSNVPYLLHKAQQQLRETEAEQRRFAAQQSGILNALPAHIALLNGNGVIISVNDAWCTYAKANALCQGNYGVGQNYVEVCESAVGPCSEDAIIAASGIRSVLDGQSPKFAFDYPCHSASERRWFQLLVTPLHDVDLRGAVVAHIDITERKLMEEDVRQYASRLAALVRSQQELATTTADAGHIMHEAAEMVQHLTASDGAAFAVIVGDELVYRATSGITVGRVGLRTKLASSLAEEAILQNQTSRCDDTEMDERQDTFACRNVGLRSMIVTVIRDKERPVAIISSVARKPKSFGDRDANILGLFAESLGTILQRRRAENELRIRALQQAAIAEIGQEALTGLSIEELMNKTVAAVARTFGVEYASILQCLPDEQNATLVAGVGWPPGAVGKVSMLPKQTSLFGYTMRSEGPVVLDNLASRATIQESPLLRQEGIVSGVSVAIGERDNQWGALGAFSKRNRSFTPYDISFVQSLANLIAEANRRQLTQDALTQHAALLDVAQEAILVCTLDNKILFWNKGAERMYGWKRLEAVGCFTDDLFWQGTAESKQDRDRAIKLGGWSGVVRHRRKDGSELTAQVQWTLIRDNRGNPQSTFSIATDVTAQLLIEEQLRQSQRLEAVGQLTGGVAHDFNNLLTVISLNAELLVESLAGEDSLRGMADMILNTANTGTEVTRRLLAFARRQPLDPKVINANQLLTGMEPLLRRTLGRGVEIAVLQAPDLWNTSVDPSLFESSLLNLCINARDAMPSGGRLVIESANVLLEKDSLSNVEASPGEYVLVSVSDNGIGIPAEHLDRVFDPFFTTKDLGKGTGLGLSMVYGFVKQSGGNIEIYSQLGEGTIVKMFLPRSTQVCSVETKEDPTLSLADLGGTEHILLVEDEDSVRTNVAGQLVSLGYSVTTAANGLAALEIVQKTTDVDLLFTDVLMPGGMNGRALADHAVALRPSLSVLYTSGYSDRTMINNGRLEEGIHFLEKPYSRIMLARKIRAALAARTSNTETI
jgi:PAS domain S-box-containing protein